LVVSAALVAVMFTLVVVETVGAVNAPVVDTLPAVADQLTAVLLVPWTVALNCWIPPEITVVLFGEMLTLIIVPGGFTLTFALAFFVLSAALVAVTVTVVLLVTFGAVNKPLLEMVPAVAVHLTAVLVVP
jgi:hypothetical protein